MLTNVTIAENRAALGGGGINDEFGSGPVVLKATIVATILVAIARDRSSTRRGTTSTAMTPVHSRNRRICLAGIRYSVPYETTEAKPRPRLCRLAVRRETQVERRLPDAYRRTSVVTCGREMALRAI